MLALAKQLLGYRVKLEPKPLAEPEPAYAQPRPMVGFLALLTPEQRAALLSYKDRVCMGDAADPLAHKKS